MNWGEDKFAFGTAAGLRTLEGNGIAEIGTRKSNAVLRGLPKSSIAAAPSLQSTQICTHSSQGYRFGTRDEGDRRAEAYSSIQTRSPEMMKEIGAFSSRESYAWRMLTALAHKSMSKPR